MSRFDRWIVDKWLLFDSHAEWDSKSVIKRIPHHPCLLAKRRKVNKIQKMKVLHSLQTSEKKSNKSWSDDSKDHCLKLRIATSGLNLFYSGWAKEIILNGNIPEKIHFFRFLKERVIDGWGIGWVIDSGSIAVLNGLSLNYNWWILLQQISKKWFEFFIFGESMVLKMEQEDQKSWSWRTLKKPWKNVLEQFEKNGGPPTGNGTSYGN